MDIIIDAERCIAGRTASVAAKELLKGKSVFIVNSEQAVITGDTKFTIKNYKEKVERGDPYHGPFYPRTPDRMLKRMVRGMLPYKKPMGRQAFKKLRVYISVPEELKGREFKPGPQVKPEEKFITLGKLSERLK